MTALLVAALFAAAPDAGIPLEEASIADLQKAMADGRTTSRALVDAYLSRIEALDKQGPKLNAIIELNPDARATADALDAERKAKGARGPLHGIPIVIKDNLDTADKMSTTAGSLALEGSHAAKDAVVVARLRAAGAVILAKTNLSEWANFRSTKSTSGWSGRGGQTRNPYVLDRSPCGSSSGTGVAVSANLAAAGVGTETDGSVVCPSSMNGLVGVKPTVGVVSRTGIIPISHSQDTAGPMARSVADAALLLAAMAGPNPEDPATRAIDLKPAEALKADALKGARIGVLRGHFVGYHDGTDALYAQALADLKAQGAVLVDPVELAPMPKGPDCEDELLQYEFKADLDAYLGKLPPSVPVHSLAELIAFDEREKPRELPFFGQELFVASQKEGPLTSAGYLKVRDACRARGKALDALFKSQKLDALVAPTTGPAWTIDLVTGDHYGGGSSAVAAVSGFPSVSVPAGFTFELPVGLSFIGPAWSDARLLGYAFAYEQATKHRRAPHFLPSVP